MTGNIFFDCTICEKLQDSELLDQKWLVLCQNEGQVLGRPIAWKNYCAHAQCLKAKPLNSSHALDRAPFFSQIISNFGTAATFTG